MNKFSLNSVKRYRIIKCYVRGWSNHVSFQPDTSAFLICQSRATFVSISQFSEILTNVVRYFCEQFHSANISQCSAQTLAMQTKYYRHPSS